MLCVFLTNNKTTEVPNFNFAVGTTKIARLMFQCSSSTMTPHAAYMRAE